MLVSARPERGAPVWSSPPQDAYEEADLICQQILEARDKGFRSGRWRYSIAIIRQHPPPGRTPGTWHSLHGSQRPAFFEQAHIKDVLAHYGSYVNPRDEASWRRLLLLLPGIGPAKAAAIYRAHRPERATHSAALESAEAMARCRPRARDSSPASSATSGSCRATDPERNPGRRDRGDIQRGLSGTVRLKYERPDNRIADIEQFALLAARYDSLERLIAEMMLAGDVYGMDSMAATEPQDVLVLSTVHQAKGLEWSHVFVLRLIEESFPHRSSLDEPEARKKKRRIFYVAISRAMNELTLTYPLTHPARAVMVRPVFTNPSRFLTEIDEGLFERAEMDRSSISSGDRWTRTSRPIAITLDHASDRTVSDRSAIGRPSCRSSPAIPASHPSGASLVGIVPVIRAADRAEQ